ncbi:MAG: RsiV family protein, partial [Bacillota bacterium]
VQTWNPCSFYMVPEGLAVYFQQYDIAPYVMGIPVFVIPC